MAVVTRDKHTMQDTTRIRKTHDSRRGSGPLRLPLSQAHCWGMTDMSQPDQPPAAEPLFLTALIELVGVNPYVRIVADQAELLKSGWRRPMPVVVRINRAPNTLWRTNMMPVGEGAFNLYLHGQMREASQTSVGDPVKLELWFDEAYVNGPQHLIPAWFQAALDLDSVAHANWERLPPSRQKEL